MRAWNDDTRLRLVQQEIGKSVVKKTRRGIERGDRSQNRIVNSMLQQMDFFKTLNLTQAVDLNYRDVTGT